MFSFCFLQRPRGNPKQCIKKELHFPVLRTKSQQNAKRMSTNRFVSADTEKRSNTHENAPDVQRLSVQFRQLGNSTQTWIQSSKLQSRCIAMRNQNVRRKICEFSTVSSAQQWRRKQPKLKCLVQDHRIHGCEWLYFPRLKKNKIRLIACECMRIIVTWYCRKFADLPPREFAHIHSTDTHKRL